MDLSTASSSPCLGYLWIVSPLTTPCSVLSNRCLRQASAHAQPLATVVEPGVSVICPDLATSPPGSLWMSFPVSSYKDTRIDKACQPTFTSPSPFPSTPDYAPQHNPTTKTIGPAGRQFGFAQEWKAFFDANHTRKSFKETVANCRQ